MVYNDYNERRKILAEQCADSLGIKEIPEELRALAIQRCDLPSEIIDENTEVAKKENSLLSIGVVYSYGTTLNFITRDGHTCILPYTEIIVKELEKCGYTICSYGSKSPEFGYPSNRYSSVETNLTEEQLIEKKKQIYKAQELEKSIREKCTLSKELAELVCIAESRGNSDFLEAERRSAVVREFSYDVFSEDLYRGYEFGTKAKTKILEFLGYDSEIGRKFLAFTTAGNVPLNRPYSNVTDLQTYFEYIKNNEFLNDDMYFGPGGFYEQVAQGQGVQR